MRKAVTILDAQDERRGSRRFLVEVPATLTVGSDDHMAKLLNVVGGGAMLETRARLMPNSRITFRCGSVTVDAVVIWRTAQRIGINFRTSLSDADIDEHLLRSEALADRRRLRSKLSTSP